MSQGKKHSFWNATTRIYLYTCLALSFIGGLIGWARTGDALISFLTVACICIVAFVWLVIDDGVGKKRHRSVLDSKTYLPLKEELGFVLEELNNGEYSGYCGVYRSYFFRVYYNWDSTYLQSRNADREFCVMLYYQPVLLNNGEVDIERLNRLNSSYNKPVLFYGVAKKLVFETSHLDFHRAHTFLTRYKHVRAVMDECVDIALKEKLMPISHREANLLIKEDPFLHGPDIETFYDPDAEDE